MDFEANAKEGVGIPWPVSYDEIAPWYDKAEIFAGISGSVEGSAAIARWQFLPPHDLNCVEQDFKKTLADKLGRKLIIGRCANLTAPLTHNESPQRGTCQARNMCIRGCPFGGYFSSVSATLPSAERTGNMTLLADQIVYEVIYDNEKGKATGVRVLDAKSGAQTDYFRQGHLPVRLVAGHGVPDAELHLEPLPERLRQRPRANWATTSWITTSRVVRAPRWTVISTWPTPAAVRMASTFRAIATSARTSATICAASATRDAPRARVTGRFNDSALIGAELKQAFQEPGPWNISMTAFGEILPYHENHMRLDRDKKDKHGCRCSWSTPSCARTSARWKGHAQRRGGDARGRRLQERQGRTATFHVGNSIHEMGTARMGTIRRSRC
jgi:choline dehydrogenase-like flavoprotein